MEQKIEKFDILVIIETKDNIYNADCKINKQINNK